MTECVLRTIHPDFWHPLMQQRIFRKIMTAFAYPGSVVSLVFETRDGQEAVGLVLAALLDGETTLADVQWLLSELNWERLEVKKTDPDQARFLLAKGSAAPAFTPSLGTLEEPEGGATIILNVDKLGEGLELDLDGPGIEPPKTLLVKGLNSAWLQAREDWVSSFPLGVDILLVDGNSVAALPRTTHVTVAGGDQWHTSR
jgi:alpha-D-ribose 1-methylphosphonate 5-triphosphate synthase subunit PhnH